MLKIGLKWIFKKVFAFTHYFFLTEFHLVEASNYLTYNEILRLFLWIFFFGLGLIFAFKFHSAVQAVLLWLVWFLLNSKKNLFDLLLFQHELANLLFYLLSQYETLSSDFHSYVEHPIPKTKSKYSWTWKQLPTVTPSTHYLSWQTCLLLELHNKQKKFSGRNSNQKLKCTMALVAWPWKSKIYLKKTRNIIYKEYNFFQCKIF